MRSRDTTARSASLRLVRVRPAARITALRAAAVRLTLAIMVLAAAAPPLAAQQAAATFGDRVAEIIARPEFAHAHWGIELYSLDAGRTLWSLNGEKLFTPASTTKMLTEGTALGLLGADHRFTTRVYGTGPVSEGTLRGDLVLVASGDPNLSNRIRPDGTLAFENHDHAYDGSPDTKAVPGDPLQVIRGLAEQVAAKGVRRVEGHVRVDVSLFPEGTRELGSGVVISPVSVNDNLVDVTIGPGANEGAPVQLSQSPQTSYVRFVNEARTGPAGEQPSIRWSEDVRAPDGTHTVTVTGTFPAGEPAWLFSYAVPEPSRYAAVTFAEALRDIGVEAQAASPADTVDFARVAGSYTDANVLAEHVSPPLSEEIKVTLKVSQNLHASMMPYILGALVKGEHEDALQAGFDAEREFLEKAGLDLSGASQGDGAGGDAYFTPAFMVRYLAYLAGRDDFDAFHRALPVLGRDGTLWNIGTDSPAAGHVYAKTGTFVVENRLNRNLVLTAKALAGYMTRADGQRLAFAFYVNMVQLPPDVPDAATVIAGQALGDIAAAAYSLPIAPRATPDSERR